MQRTFASLSAQQALSIAISIEERNAEIYHRFAEMFTEFGDQESLEIASVFWEMAVEERGHHSLLQRKYLEQYGCSNPSCTEEELVELIEVPRLDDDVFAVGDGRSGRQRALQVAFQAEVSAQQFYSKLVEQTPDGPLRRTYHDLAQMEDGHIAFLEAKLADDSGETQVVQ